MLLQVCQGLSTYWVCFLASSGVATVTSSCLLQLISNQTEVNTCTANFLSFSKRRGYHRECIFTLLKRSSQVTHLFVCYPCDHVCSEDNVICSRSDAANVGFQIHFITLCSLCKIFPSMSPTVVYHECRICDPTSRSQMKSFFFFFLIILYSRPSF